MTQSGANLSRGSASERDIETLDSVYTCRKALADMLGGYEKRSAKYISLTANITESINIILKGILKPGMRVTLPNSQVWTR